MVRVIVLGYFDYDEITFPSINSDCQYEINMFLQKNDNLAIVSKVGALFCKIPITLSKSLSKEVDVMKYIKIDKIYAAELYVDICSNIDFGKFSGTPLEFYTEGYMLKLYEKTEFSKFVNDSLSYFSNIYYGVTDENISCFLASLESQICIVAWGQASGIDIVSIET